METITDFQMMFELMFLVAEARSNTYILISKVGRFGICKPNACRSTTTKTSRHRVVNPGQRRTAALMTKKQRLAWTTQVHSHALQSKRRPSVCLHMPSIACEGRVGRVSNQTSALVLTCDAYVLAGHLSDHTTFDVAKCDYKRASGGVFLSPQEIWRVIKERRIVPCNVGIASLKVWSICCMLKTHAQIHAPYPNRQTAIHHHSLVQSLNSYMLARSLIRPLDHKDTDLNPIRRLQSWRI